MLESYVIASFEACLFAAHLLFIDTGDLQALRRSRGWSS